MLNSEQKFKKKSEKSFVFTPKLENAVNPIDLSFRKHSEDEKLIETSENAEFLQISSKNPNISSQKNRYFALQDESSSMSIEMTVFLLNFL